MRYPPPVARRHRLSDNELDSLLIFSNDKTCELLAAIKRSRLLGGSVLNGTELGSVKLRTMRAKLDFAVPCSPWSTKIGYGPRCRKAASKKATTRTKSLSSLMFRNCRSVLIGVPRRGNGNASIPLVRRNRTGGD